MIRPTSDAEFDTFLGTLLAAPDGDGDRAFANRVERAIDAQTAYARARSRFWRSFAVEAVTIVALLAGLWILSTTPLLAAFAGPSQWGMATPLLLVLLLWFATQRLREA